MTRSITSLLAGAAALSLSACVSVLPSPDTPDALYMITAADPVPLQANIIIREPETARIYAGQAIVSEDSSGAVRLLPRAEWAGPATRQMQLALVESFANQPSGAAFLPESGVFAPYELSIRLSRFGLTPDSAECAASVTVVEAGTRSAFAHETVTEQVALDSRSSARRAQAMKQAAEACVGAISDLVSKALSD